MEGEKPWYGRLFLDDERVSNLNLIIQLVTRLMITRSIILGPSLLSAGTNEFNLVTRPALKTGQSVSGSPGNSWEVPDNARICY